VSTADDIIYVDNAAALPEPNFDSNLWGVITINAERIMYRERDTVNNTVSSLMRGTAGTAITAHDQGAIVYNLGRTNLMSKDNQDYFESNSFEGDNSSTEFVTSIVVDNRPIVYVGGSVEVYINNVQLDQDEYTITQVEPVVVVLDSIPQSGSNVLVQVTYLDSTQETAEITSTGSSARFPTEIDIGLEEQASNTYVLDDFSPVTITFDTAPPADHVVYIRNQRGAEDEFDFSIANGTQTQFVTDIDLSLPVEVYVGGARVLDGYTIVNDDPISVLFDQNPPGGVEVTILIRRGVTWYAPGPDTASDGVALQDTNTQAARFLRGLA
jgi:hypothetical protein